MAVDFVGFAGWFSRSPGVSPHGLAAVQRGWSDVLSSPYETTA